MRIEIDIAEEDYKELVNKVLTVGEMYETTYGRLCCAIARSTIIEPQGYQPTNRNTAR